MRLNEAEYLALLEKRGQTPARTQSTDRLPPARARLEELKAAVEKAEHQDSRLPTDRLPPARARLGALKAAAEKAERADAHPPARAQLKRLSENLRSPHAIALIRLERNPDLYFEDREYFDQVRVFRHFELIPGQEIYSHLAAIPNGGIRLGGVAGKLKASGQKKGYPDIVLDLPRGGYHGLRIELKALPDPERGYAGGQLSKTQVEYLNRLHLAGYYCAVCFGSEDAISTIEAYCALADGGLMPAKETDVLWMAA